MLAEGLWAEVKVGGEHLHLFAERRLPYITSTLRIGLHLPKPWTIFSKG
jgi:hypothetical protein